MISAYSVKRCCKLAPQAHRKKRPLLNVWGRVISSAVSPYAKQVLILLVCLLFGKVKMYAQKVNDKMINTTRRISKQDIPGISKTGNTLLFPVFEKADSSSQQKLLSPWDLLTEAIKETLKWLLKQIWKQFKIYIRWRRRRRAKI